VPSSDPVQRFEDILENIVWIEEFTAGMDLDAFTQNAQALYAVKYALLTISEAAKKLGDVGTEMCPEIPWRQIQGLGNHLRHEYDRIDVTRIWLVLQKDLAPLKAAIERALKTFPS